PLDLLWREGVKRVAGHDGVPQAGGLGVEAGRTVAAAEDAPGQVFVRQSEHAPVLLEGPAPGDDLVQPDGHWPSPLLRARPPAPHRRFPPLPPEEPDDPPSFSPPAGPGDSPPLPPAAAVAGPRPRPG